MYSKYGQFSINFHHNSKNENRKNLNYDFSFVSAHSTSFIKNLASSEGGGSAILAWDRDYIHKKILYSDALFAMHWFEGIIGFHFKTRFRYSYKFLPHNTAPKNAINNSPTFLSKNSLGYFIYIYIFLYYIDISMPL